MGLMSINDKDFNKLSITDRIITCIKAGLTYKQIQLECGSPSKKLIKKVIKEEMPELHQYLSDTRKMIGIRGVNSENFFKDK
jgi:hypothetical protein